MQASLKVHWCRDSATLVLEIEEYRSLHVTIQHAILCVQNLGDRILHEQEYPGGS